MEINYEKIREAFKGKAWAYAEQLDSVKIGKWDGNKGFDFHAQLEERYLLLLRVFDKDRELMFTGDRCRDTEEAYKTFTAEYIPELADAKYLIYGYGNGVQYDSSGNYTVLREDRGGVIRFPGKLDFPDGKSMLRLGIRNYVRYNPVPVLPKDEDNAGLGLAASGAGALEVVDYAYTGFYYADGKEVAL